MRHDVQPGDLVVINRDEETFDLFTPPWDAGGFGNTVCRFRVHAAVMLVVTRVPHDEGRPVKCDYLCVMASGGIERGSGFGWIPTAYVRPIG